MTQAPRGSTIREVRPGDLRAVQRVNAAVFGSQAEAELVARLRDDGDVLFGLVTTGGEEIVGHVLFSRLPIAMPGSMMVNAAALAPLAVLPAWQRQGVGTALVQRGLEQCRELLIPAVVVLGDPAYYARFGFHADLARGLQTPWSGPHLMAIELTPGSLGDRCGVARYAAAFAAAS